MTKEKEIKLKKIKEECNNCYKCELGNTRKNIVFSDILPLIKQNLNDSYG